MISRPAALENVSTSLMDRSCRRARVSAARFESLKLETRLMPRFRIGDCLLLLRCHVYKGHRPASDIGHIAIPLLNCLPLYQGGRQRSVE